MKLEDLKNKCQIYNINLSDKQLEKFHQYALLLKEYNEKINLTAITEYEEVIEKHFYDSILPFLKNGITGSLADVGAGAGFPSIPLKIVFEDLEVTIIEPLNKRCVFLNELVKKLELSKVNIVNDRAEEYAKVHRESFDIVTARAVANLNMLAELCIPLVKLNGYFISLKGKSGNEEYENAKKAISILGCKLEKNEELNLNEQTRVNLYFKKVKNTASKYPRHFSKIKKQPL